MDKRVKGLDRPFTDAIDAMVSDVQMAASARITETEQASEGEQRRVLFTMILALLVGMAAAAFFSMRMVRTITEPLLASVNAAQRLAQGDLTMQLHARGNDEIAQLTSALGSMVQHLSKIISEIGMGAGALSAASTQVSATAQTLSMGTSSQAASVEETSATLHEMTSSITVNAQNARRLEELAVKGSKDAHASAPRSKRPYGP